MRLSPAHALVLGQLVRLVAPAAAAGALLLALRRLELAAAAPAWAGVLVALLTVPAFHVCRARWLYSRYARKAARLGATLPPRWEGRLPGSVDILKLMDYAFRKGFLSEFRFVPHSRVGMCAEAGFALAGDYFYEKFDELGPTFNLYVLWAWDCCTQDAAVIKVGVGPCEAVCFKCNILVLIRLSL